MTLLVESIERKYEIDVERARSSKERAEQRLQDKNASEIDIQRAKASLLRALNRLSVSDNN